MNKEHTKIDTKTSHKFWGTYYRVLSIFRYLQKFELACEVECILLGDLKDAKNGQQPCFYQHPKHKRNKNSVRTKICVEIFI